MKQVHIPESDKYFANTMFVAAFALFSFDGAILIGTFKAEIRFFDPLVVFAFVIATIVAVYLLGWGWYITGRRESKYAKSTK